MSLKEQVYFCISGISEYEISDSEKLFIYLVIKQKVSHMCFYCLMNNSRFVEKINGINLCDRCNVSSKIIATSTEEKYREEHEYRLNKHYEKNKNGGFENWLRTKILELLTEHRLGVYKDNDEDEKSDEDEMSDDEFKVERIVEHCPLTNKYKVKWVGYTEMTWEPIENLDNCEELLQEFLDS